MARSYLFTIKRDLQEHHDFFEKIKPEGSTILDPIHYIEYQEEQGEGDDEGRTHLQAMIQFNKQQRRSAVEKLFTENGFRKPYIDQIQNPNAYHNYVTKEITRVPYGFHFQYGVFQGQGKKRAHDDDGNFTAKKIKVFEWLVEGNDPDDAILEFGTETVLKLNMKGLKDKATKERQARRKHAIKEKAKQWWIDGAYKWQKEAKSILQAWYRVGEDRKVLVILDRQGGAGKTIFGKRMVEESPTTAAYIKKSKVDNMSYLIKDRPDLQYVVVDYTRDDEKFGGPKFLEMLKDGTIQSNKYEPTQVGFDGVQVCVMTNSALDWTSLSTDRWVIYEMDHGYVINGGEPQMTRWSNEQFEDSLADVIEEKNKRINQCQAKD